MTEMVSLELGSSLDIDRLGSDISEFVSQLFPICRSITGNGLRKTLRIIGEIIPLEVREVPTGTQVFDWEVPKEWNIRDAYVKNSKGERVVDFRKSNLHVVNYSVPVHGKVSLPELREHLFTIPEHPDWVPYRTSYYKESWGFCLSHRELLDLEDGEYDVAIDSSLLEGSLTYGECYLQGRTSDEILISAHACHPSLCNDNLSGVAVAVFLAQLLGTISSRYSYRFLFGPGTLGAIAWLALNESHVSRVRHGLVLACLGDRSPITYKRSRRGDAEIDRAFQHVFGHSGHPHRIVDFSPSGFDERQFCSPGFNLPVGCLMRSGSDYEENHTSADNLDLICPSALADSLVQCLAVFDVLENNRTYVGVVQKGEPMLSNRGLYRTVGGRVPTQTEECAMRWVLNMSDGGYSLLDIAEKSNIPFDQIKRAAAVLRRAELLFEKTPGDGFRA
jgi:aminopeptidase-like protein